MTSTSSLAAAYDSLVQSAHEQPGLTELLAAYNLQNQVMQTYAVAASTIGKVNGIVHAINSVPSKN